MIPGGLNPYTSIGEEAMRFNPRRTRSARENDAMWNAARTPAGLVIIVPVQ